MTTPKPGWSRCPVVLLALALSLLWVSPFRAAADTVHIQIEFSEGSPRSFALTRSGSFSSGVVALTALMHALGGVTQRFDHPSTPSPTVSGNWIQWWRWGFGLSLNGMSLNGQNNSGWTSNYWALYTRESSAAPFVSSWVGLADLIPTDGSGIVLKFSGFEGGAPPAENLPSEAVSSSVPVNPDPPRILSLRPVSSEVLELVFSTVPGVTYRLETSTDLSAESWFVWISPFVATSSSTSFTVPVDPDQPRKFFRLALLP